MSIRTRMTLAIGVVLAVIGSLVIVGMTQANTYYWTIDELLAAGDEAVGKSVKLSGLIVGDSIQWDEETMILTLDLRSEDGATLTVVYNGIKPDTLNDGWESVVEGKLDENGVFQAEQLLVKCPSKYEALEEEGGTHPGSYQD